MATQQPAASAGAEKLVSLIRPMIAEAQAQQTQVLREFIKTEMIAHNEDLCERLAEIRLDVSNLKVRLGSIEKDLQEGKKKNREPVEDPFKAQLVEIEKKLASILTAVNRVNANNIANGLPDRVPGLPPNVLMKETGPSKNMFSREDDEFDIDCD